VHLGALVHRLRGFATNVGGYQPLGAACPVENVATLPIFCRHNPREPCCASDPCGLIERFNGGVGELNYLQLLAHHVRIALPDVEPRFLVDTGRNGVARSRVDCATACNLRGAGLGRLPSSHTALPQVDAYYWLLPPGVSDGCTAGPLSSTSAPPLCVRADPACARDDAFGARPREEIAPAAGELFLPLLRRLAAQATGDAAYANFLLLRDNEAAENEGSQALRHAAAEAAAFASRAGVPSAWAVGLVDPIPLVDGMGAEAGGESLVTLAAAAAAVVMTVAGVALLFRKRGRRISVRASAVRDDDDAVDADLDGLEAMRGRRLRRKAKYAAPEAVGLLETASVRGAIEPVASEDHEQAPEPEKLAEDAEAVMITMPDDYASTDTQERATWGGDMAEASGEPVEPPQESPAARTESQGGSSGVASGNTPDGPPLDLSAACATLASQPDVGVGATPVEFRVVD